VNNELARFIYADAPTAKNLNELLAKLKSENVTENDDLLCYDAFPLVNYLTKTKSPLGNSWPIIYSSSVFARRMVAMEKDGKRPVIITMRRENWPNHLLQLRIAKREKICDSVLSDFLARNQYQKIWQNDWFEIWKPTVQS